MAVLAHVDEIVDHDAAQVAEPELPGDFLGRDLVELEGRFLGRAVGAEAAAVDVDGDQGLRLIDDQRSAATERDLPLVDLCDRFGNGTLTIAAGGSVSNTNGFIGPFLGSTGLATVTGANSQWMNSGNLTIGNSGTGTLNIEPGGTVSVAQDVALLPGGTLNLDGGTLDTASVSFQGGGAFNFLGGTLHVGIFNGNLTNVGGALAPGHSAGSTTIIGNYTQQAGAKLELEIGGTSAGGTHDLVGITGNAILGGQLQLAMLGGFVPSASDSFTVLNAAGGIFGVFTNVTTGQRLTTMDGNGSFFVHYGPGSAFNQNQIVLSAFEAVLLPGDYNQNGTVDAADYTVWRDNLGGAGSTLGVHRDPANTGVVSVADYNSWKAHFGQTAGAGSGATAGLLSSANAAVPEPTALALLTIGLALLVPTARRNRRAQSQDQSANRR